MLTFVENLRSDALLPIFIRARLKVVNKQDKGIFVIVTYEGIGYDYHSQTKVRIQEKRVYNKKSGERTATGTLTLDQRGLVFTKMVEPESLTNAVGEKWAASGGQGELVNATGDLDRSSAGQTQPNVEEILIYGFIQF